MPSSRSRRAPRIQATLRRLATKACEKCGLATAWTILCMFGRPTARHWVAGHSDVRRAGRRNCVRPNIGMFGHWDPLNRRMRTASRLGLDLRSGSMPRSAPRVQ